MWWASCRQGFQQLLQVPAMRNGLKALSELSGCDRKGRRHRNRGDSPARRPRRGRGRVRVPGGSRPFSLATSNASLSRAQNLGASCSPEHKIQGHPAAQSTNFRGVVQPSNLVFHAGRLASGSHLRRPVSGGTAVLF